MNQIGESLIEKLTRECVDQSRGHLCIRPACPANCCGCNHAISQQDVRDYAIRYAYLRSRPLEAIHAGGIFIGSTPDNFVLNEEGADAAIDAELAALKAGKDRP